MASHMAHPCVWLQRQLQVTAPRCVAGAAVAGRAGAAGLLAEEAGGREAGGRGAGGQEAEEEDPGEGETEVSWPLRSALVRHLDRQ